MLYSMNKCIDPRGKSYVDGIFKEIALSMNCDTVEDAINKMEILLKGLQMQIPEVKNSDLDEMTLSVNTDRLKNNPVKLEKENIKEIYIKVFEK